jgi:hypothetical protein
MLGFFALGQQALGGLPDGGLNATAFDETATFQTGTLTLYLLAASSDEAAAFGTAHLFSPWLVGTAYDEPALFSTGKVTLILLATGYGEAASFGTSALFTELVASPHAEGAVFPQHWLGEVFSLGQGIISNPTAITFATPEDMDDTFISDARDYGDHLISPGV